MSDYSDFVAKIAEWANREDWTDALAASFLRLAEDQFNMQLRVDWMVQSDTGLIVSREVALPDDWLEADLIRGSNGYPLHYKSRDEFYNRSDSNAAGYYTIVGRKLVLGGAPVTLTGQTIYLDYYGQVPQFSEATPSFLYSRYNGLYLFAALQFASVHGVEDERAAGFQATVADQIKQLNDRHLMSKASGSRVSRTRTRTFG